MRRRRSFALGVEELEGRALLSTFAVTNTNDSGAGSFRQAILNANSTPGANTISFAIGSGVQTIMPASPLPAITNPVTIDGTTQPGFSGTPIIVLDGSGAGSNANGLMVTAGNSTVRGLVIDNFNEDGIALAVVGNDRITGNYIGTDVTGTRGRGNSAFGVDIEGGQGNTIGGTAPGAGNVISGNGLGGIRVLGPCYFVSQDNNILCIDSQTGAVLASYPTGVANDAVALGADDSVYVTDYYGNQVLHFDADGTPLPSFGAGYLNGPQDLVFGPDGNLYVGNAGGGVQEFSPSGTFLRTFIPNGSGGLGNVKGITFGPDGNVYVADLTNNDVLRYNGSTGAFLGTFVTSGSGGLSYPEDLQFGPDGNLYVSSYNTDSIIRYNGSTGALLGTFVTTPAHPYGIRFDSAGNLDVACRTAGLIRTYNGSTGAFVQNLATGLTNPAWFTTWPATSGGNVIQGNLIGTNASGSGGIGNDLGILVAAANNTIGGTVAGAANIIAQNGGRGVIVTGGSGNTIEENVIYGDADLGIDLGNDGVTPNTGTENSALPNDGMNFPVITVAAINGTTLTLAGYVGTAPGQAAFAGARVEFFAASQGPNNNGQGQRYLGSLTTDANGVFNGSLTASGLSKDNPITATATDTANNTSEFGVNVALATGPVINLDTDGFGSTYSATYPANTPPVAVENVSDATITDPASATLVSLTATIQNPQDAFREVLTANTAGTNILAAFSGNRLILSGTDTLAHYQQVLRTIGYQDQATSPNTQYVRYVLLTANDGTQSGATETTAVTVTANALRASSTSVRSSLNPSVYGQTVTFTATVAALGGVLATPTGSLSFLDGLTVLGTATLSGGAATFATTGLAAGSDSITVHYGGDLEFRGSTSTALMQTVTPAVLTVTATNATRTYGAANPAFGDTITGFVNGDTSTVVSGTATLTTTATASSSIGGYPITAAPGSLSAADYTFSFSSGTLTITPATLTVTANNASKVYGAANPTFTDSISGFVNGDTLAVVSGTASVTTTATASSGVGGYPITAAQGSLSAANYTFSFSSGTLTITPATLTVTANNASKVYGAANPSFSDTITGFVNGDTAAVVSGSAGLSTSAASGSPVGAYVITAAQGDLTAANYTFAFVNGSLSVAQAPLTVTAVDTSKVAGQPNPAFTASYSGFVNGDGPSVLGGTLSFATLATTNSPVGTYSITPSGLTSANYALTFVAGTLHVTTAPLANSSASIVSSGSPSVYGQTVTLTATVSLVAPATGTPTGVVTFVDGANDLATVSLTGGVAVFATATLSAANHSITVRYSGNASVASSTSNTLTQTVSPAPLTVTANDASKAYGAANPGFSVRYQGFVNGDSPGALNGTLSFSTSATPQSAVGPYAVTPGGLTSGNYAITFASGTLNVTPAPLIVTANEAAKTYGQPNPTLGDAITGFVNGDTAAVVSGTPSLTTAAGASSGVGHYTIVAARGSLSAANYTFTFVNGTLAITPAVLTVTANDASKVYGAANPAFSASITGFANGETAAVVSGSARLTTGASIGSGVGAYTIAAAQGSLSAANYTFGFANGTLTISPAVLTVTANDASLVAGQPAPSFSYTISGFANGDTAASVSGSPSLTSPATASSGAGTYPIVASQGTLSAANYRFTLVNGTLTIQAAIPTPTSGGAAPPAPTLTALPPASLAGSEAPSSAALALALAASAAPAASLPGAGSAASTGSASGNAASAAAVAAAAHSSGAHQPVAADAAVVNAAPPVPSAPAPAAPAAPGSAPPPSPIAASAPAAPPAPAPSAPPPSTSLSSPVRAPELQTEALWEALDEFQPEIERRPASSLLKVGVITGLVASAGYLVFSARASYWLLTLLLAKPLVWKRLDPIEVLFAWEKEKQRRAKAARDGQAADEESLQSLVGARRKKKS